MFPLVLPFQKTSRKKQTRSDLRCGTTYVADMRIKPSNILKPSKSVYMDYDQIKSSPGFSCSPEWYKAYQIRNTWWQMLIYNDGIYMYKYIYKGWILSLIVIFSSCPHSAFHAIIHSSSPPLIELFVHHSLHSFSPSFIVQHTWTTAGPIDSVGYSRRGSRTRDSNLLIHIHHFIQLPFKWDVRRFISISFWSNLVMAVQWPSRSHWLFECVATVFPWSSRWPFSYQTLSCDTGRVSSARL